MKQLSLQNKRLIVAGLIKLYKEGNITENDKKEIVELLDYIADHYYDEISLG